MVCKSELTAEGLESGDTEREIGREKGLMDFLVWICSPLCSKNFNFLVKMKCMWAVPHPPVVVAGLQG